MSTKEKVILAAILIGLCRLAVHPGTPAPVDFYKDISHLFMGGVFVAWRIQKQKWQMVTFWVMSGREVFVAIGSRLIW